MSTNPSETICDHFLNNVLDENRLYELIVNTIRSDLDEQDAVAIAQSIKHSIRGDGIKPLPPKNSQDEWKKLIFKIASKYFDLLSTLDNMKQTYVYVNYYPNKETHEEYRITRTDYLSYHVEFYLQETYIFKERLIGMINDVDKWYKRYVSTEDNRKTLKIKTFAETTLDDLRIVRKNHVHIKKYEDNNLASLKTLELFTDTMSNTSKNDDIYLISKTLKYREAKKAIRKTIKDNATVLTMLVVNIGEMLYDILVDELKPQYDA